MAATLRAPSETVIEVLLLQSLIGSQRGDPYLPWLKRYTELLVAELQVQVISAERQLKSRRRPRTSTRHSEVPFTYEGRCRGHQPRGGKTEFFVPDQVDASPADFDGVAVSILHTDGSYGWGIVRASKSEPGRAVVAVCW